MSNTKAVVEWLQAIHGYDKIVRFMLKSADFSEPELRKLTGKDYEQAKIDGLLSFLVRKEMIVRKGMRKGQNVYSKEMEFYSVLREMISGLPPVAIAETRASERKKIIELAANEVPCKECSELLQNSYDARMAIKLLPHVRFCVERLQHKKYIEWEGFSEWCNVAESDARLIMSFLIRVDMLSRERFEDRHRRYVKTSEFTTLLAQIVNEFQNESEW